MAKLQSIWLAAGLLFALSVPGLAETVTLGRASMDLPEGWEKQESSTGILLSRTFPETDDTEQAGAMIQIVSAGGTPDMLEETVTQMVGVMPEFAGTDTMTDSSGATSNGHAIRVEYRCCEYREDLSMGQTVAGVSAEKDQVVASMIFMNVSSDHEDTADADFEALVRSIRFEGDGDNKLHPLEGDGGLEGVFTHLETGLMPNVFGGVDFTAESEITVFDPEGLFSHVIPVGGESVGEHCAAAPRDCGTYRLKGGGWFSDAIEIEMRSVVDDYGVIETETLSFAKDGENLLIDEGNYNRLPPFPEGTTFDGSWTYLWASSGMTATSSGSVASEHTLILHPDGTFSRDGWSGASSTGDMGGVTVSSDRPGNAGTYHVAGYELTLTGADGAKEVLSLFAPDIGSDGLLVINGANYLKDEDQGGREKKKGG